MKTRIDELKKALKVHDEDYVFYTEFLDISLTADGEEVTPAAPVEVIVETDAVGASASDAVEMSFYTKKNAETLSLKNLSGDKAKDKAEDFKAFIGPDETDEDIINEIEEEIQIEKPAEVKVITSECEVFADDADDEMADVIVAPAEVDVKSGNSADTKDVSTYSIDDEESPEEFEF